MPKTRVFPCVAAMMLATASLPLLAAAPATPPPAAAPLAATPVMPQLGPFQWKSSGALIKPVSDDTHKLVSVKDPTVVYHGDKWHVYATTANDRGNWSMVYLSFKDWSEAANAKPYYRAFTADRLDGKWTPLPEADTYRTPFAGINNVTFEEGVAPWTRDISHGELLRDGYDETMTIELNNLRMLYQGRDPAIRADYGRLPYRLGLLKRDQSGNPNPTTERMP